MVFRFQEVVAAAMIALQVGAVAAADHVAAAHVDVAALLAALVGSVVVVANSAVMIVASAEIPVAE